MKVTIEIKKANTITHQIKRSDGGGKKYLNLYVGFLIVNKDVFDKICNLNVTICHDKMCI